MQSFGMRQDHGTFHPIPPATTPASYPAGVVTWYYDRFRLPDDRDRWTELMTAVANDRTVVQFLEEKQPSPDEPGILYIHLRWCTAPPTPTRGRPT